jgi:hypothetical protein
MNESEFEQELRSLRPIRPSRELESKIGRELAPAAATRTWSTSEGRRTLLERLLPAFGWGSLGAAVAVVVMLSLNLANGGLPFPGPKNGASLTGADPSLAPAGNPASAPAATSAVTGDLLEANNEGLLDSSEAGVGRRVRYSSLERRSWKDATGAVTVVEVPREDVVVVPVSVQ